MQRLPPVRVWDLPVRLLHLVLAAGVALAWWSAGDPRQLPWHVLGGWLAAGAVVARLAWGLVGPSTARLRALVPPPRAVWDHLRALRRASTPAGVGHSPLAAWGATAALGLVGALALTGWVVQGGAEGSGPAAGLVTPAQGVSAHDLHALLAWAIVGWLAAHLVGMAKESLLRRVNLPAAMVHGHQPGLPAGAAVPARAGVAAGLGLLVAAGAAAWVGPGAPAAGGRWPWPERTLATDTRWTAACGECHLAFHPSLLPARAWDALLAPGADHFGEDLGLDEPALAGLRAWASAHAAEAGESEHAVRVAAATPPDATPLRVTTLPWWEGVHAALPPETFTAPEVGSRLRCGACHADAEGGAYDAGSLSLPVPVASPPVLSPGA